jgi:hypothetical protein
VGKQFDELIARYNEASGVAGVAINGAGRIEVLDTVPLDPLRDALIVCCLQDRHTLLRDRAPELRGEQSDPRMSLEICS